MDVTPEQVETTIELPVENKNRGLRQRAATAIGLVAVSAAAYYAERNYITSSWPTELKTFAESMSHPALGYLGAWATEKVFGRFVARFRKSVTFAGATVANFATEVTQSSWFNAGAFSFMEPGNRFETGKDLLAAGGGWLLYLAQSRPRNADAAPADQPGSLGGFEPVNGSSELL